MTQRIISGEEVETAQRWEAPAVGSGPAPGKPSPRARSEAVTDRPALPTAREIEEIRRTAREEGRAEGLKEGRKAGEAAVRAEAEFLKQVLDSLVPGVQALDQQLESDLLHLITTVTRQLVRRELRADPGQIVAVVREALMVLPSTERTIRLHLHPEDARLVRDALHLSELERPWKVIEDPTLSRGGARLETDTSHVDASLETRLNALISELWGGERRHDEQGDAQGEIDRRAGSDAGDGHGAP
ncbi:flagellar assembly protein FliH [Thioalkalivibrio sulfidiphilus]|uniref:flagellar assembly protein FliH n=1 Tax=Thioalkalivibrio sulfidiphilus TaxID=1033854 RepID=UPI003B305D84